MSAARAAAYLGGAVLLGGWLASAAGVSRQPRPTRFTPLSADDARLDAVALGVQSQALRLRQRLAGAPAPKAPFRNPFAFIERETRAVAPAARPAPRPDDVRPEPVEAPLEPELLGIAEEATVRTAMIGLGDELLMVTVGQEVAGRYRVSAVGPDAVELEDLATGVTRRLALKLPASLP